MLNLDLRNFKHHRVIDNFLDHKTALKLAQEFPDYDSDKWVTYDNAVENKKTNCNWHDFPPETYKFFTVMNSLTNFLMPTFGDIYSDPGLHGGGWHIHGNGGNLNPHLDYSIHPKLGLKRKLNIIVYLSNLLPEHGGQFGFFEDGKCIEEVDIVFNRAVIFETEGTWHGMVRPLNVPEGVYRKSLAVYYLAPPDKETRTRALFAPREDQKDDKEVLDLINRRKQ